MPGTTGTTRACGDVGPCQTLDVMGRSHQFDGETPDLESSGHSPDLPELREHWDTAVSHRVGVWGCCVGLGLGSVIPVGPSDSVYSVVL